MLTNLIIRNFKKFGQAEIELGNPVVFIGPNNSGKSSALQALALWEIGLKRWNEKRKTKSTPKKRSGVAINRRDLLAIPVPGANLLWHDLHVRDMRQINGKLDTKNVRIEIIVKGVTGGKTWQCGLEFDYFNEESFYCKPLRLLEGNEQERMPVPEEADKIRIAFLPPMSGLSANEIRLDAGAINVRIGEGRTAEVLRNLCYKLYSDGKDYWGKLTEHIKTLFGSELEVPEYIAERGEIRMLYKEKGKLFDLSSSGRGIQQTLLLLSYMYVNPGAVLALDEPDAHLEILRQRQIYRVLTDVAQTNNNQVIAASHSEILLNEAAEKDVVIAFVGNPHRINDRGNQVLKALREIGFEHYYQAEQTGWVLYLEGSTDLAILQAFAQKLKYQEAIQALDKPFVHYVGNQPAKVRDHYYGLREAVPQFKGIAIFDHLEQIPLNLGVTCITWKNREIENYLCYPETLERYVINSVEQEIKDPLFAPSKCERRLVAMKESIEEVSQALKTLGKGSPWDSNTKVSDEFLTPLFQKYFEKLGFTNIMAKKNFHELAYHVPEDKVALEIKEKLDSIVKTARSASPAHEMP